MHLRSESYMLINCLSKKKYMRHILLAMSPSVCFVCSSRLYQPRSLPLHCLTSSGYEPTHVLLCRFYQKCMYTPYMTVYLVIIVPKILVKHLNSGS
jgi:hypothetical protein